MRDFIFHAVVFSMVPGMRDSDHGEAASVFHAAISPAFRRECIHDVKKDPEIE